MVVSIQGAGAPRLRHSLGRSWAPSAFAASILRRTPGGFHFSVLRGPWPIVPGALSRWQRCHVHALERRGALSARWGMTVVRGMVRAGSITEMFVTWPWLSTSIPGVWFPTSFKAREFIRSGKQTLPSSSGGAPASAPEVSSAGSFLGSIEALLRTEVFGTQKAVPASWGGPAVVARWGTSPEAFLSAPSEARVLGVPGEPLVSGSAAFPCPRRAPGCAPAVALAELPVVRRKGRPGPPSPPLLFLRQRSSAPLKFT